MKPVKSNFNFFSSKSMQINAALGKWSISAIIEPGKFNRVASSSNFYVDNTENVTGLYTFTN